MTKQIFVGLATEGNTDNRFLENIVKKTFDEIGYECLDEIETNVHYLKIQKTGLNFIEQVLAFSKLGMDKFGIMVLCIHTDSDNFNDSIAFQNKIFPAIKEIEKKILQNIAKSLLLLCQYK